MSQETETEKTDFFSPPSASAPPRPKRLGTSVDEDGKSNVWAVEPKMQVEVGTEGQAVKQISIIAGGAVAAIALVTTIVNLLPDPDTL